MSSLYRKNGIYYLDLMYNGKRYRRSLKTYNKNTAKKQSKLAIDTIIHDISNEYVTRSIPFNKLVHIYLSKDHDWSPYSRDMTERILKRYLVKGFPENHNSKAIYKNRINTCVNWGIKNRYKTNQVKYSKKEQTGIPRSRVFNSEEISKLINNIRPNSFKEFVRFSYYTGMRRGELCNMNKENLYIDHIICKGKSGVRLVKLNNQAKSILMNINQLWNYKPDYITHKFKKELRRLEIHNGRFHDLRRTFGFNLIMNGIPIYKVSKLLGHASVITTETHYAPLLTTQIEDFTL